MFWLVLIHMKSSQGFIRDSKNQNATQFENTETEKSPGRERRHERRRDKVTDANATTEAELCKSFKLGTCHVHVKIDRAGRGNNRQN